MVKNCFVFLKVFCVFEHFLMFISCSMVLSLLFDVVLFAFSGGVYRFLSPNIRKCKRASANLCAHAHGTQRREDLKAQRQRSTAGHVSTVGRHSVTISTTVRSLIHTITIDYWYIRFSMHDRWCGQKPYVFIRNMHILAPSPIFSQGWRPSPDPMFS